MKNGGGTVEITGSILADSSATNCIGAMSDGGYNLEDDVADSCGFSQRDYDLVGLDPNLEALANNGGPTQTMLPPSTSPVLNQIPNPSVAILGPGDNPDYVCPAPDQLGGASSTETDGCSIGSVDPANQVPVVKSLGSLFGPVSGGSSITINGGNFATGATVHFGKAAATGVTVDSDTQLTGNRSPIHRPAWRHNRSSNRFRAIRPDQSIPSRRLIFVLHRRLVRLSRRPCPLILQPQRNRNPAQYPLAAPTNLAVAAPGFS